MEGLILLLNSLKYFLIIPHCIQMGEIIITGKGMKKIYLLPGNCFKKLSNFREFALAG